MKIPYSIKPIWRTIQIVKFSQGIYTGLAVYIVGPYFYDAFAKITNTSQALFYATLLWAIFFGLIALLEIPTGALGDTVGRTKLVMASLVMRVLYGLSLVSICFFHSIISIAIVGLLSRLISALAYTFFNGNFSAWVIDSIKERDPNFGYERLLGRGQAYFSWATIIGCLISVVAYLHGITYIAFFAISLVSLGCLTYCMAEMEETRSMVFIHQKKMGGLVWTHVAKTTKTAINVCREAPVIWWILSIGAVYALLLNVVDYLWPIAMSAQFGKLEWSLEWYGIVIITPLCTAVGAHGLSWLGDFYQKKLNQKLSNRVLRIWLMTAFLIASLPIIVLGLMNHRGVISFPLFATGVLVVHYSLGAMEPAEETLVSHYIPHRNASERATILSLGSFIQGLLVLILMIPSNGGSGMNSPVGWILPASLLFIAVLVANPRIKAYENRFASKLKTTILNEETT